ncbi:MAG: hypothetical protein ABIC40_08205 [bacterium]
MIWLIIIGIIVYLGVGIYAMSWIRKDNEFRNSEIIDFYSYGSIILWPITWLMWANFRPSEQLQDLAAKKSYQDFKNFMRSRKKGEGDLFSRFEKTAPDKPLDITAGKREITYRDYNIEELMEKGQYQEALRTANDMLRFAREQLESDRMAAYEKYIKEIKQKRRAELS